MKKVKFEDWAELWLEYALKDRVKDNTYYSYANIVNNHLIPYFKGENLNEISFLKVQKYFNILSKSCYHDFLIKNKCLLSQIFDIGILDGKCLHNPCDKIKMPKGKQTKEKEVYSEEEAELIFQYAYTHRFGAEIQLMLETGICRYELLGLQWDDIDFENRILYIRRGVADVIDSTTGHFQVVVGSTKNEYRERAIPISERIYDILSNIDKTLIVGRNEHRHQEGVEVNKKYVFCNRYGEVCSPRNWSRRHYDVFMKDMQEFYSNNGIEIPIYTPHQLRHTRASIWVNSGKNLYAIAKVLGHSSLDMLEKRYAHSNVEQLRELLEIN